MKVEINGDYIEFSIKFETLKRNLLEELKGLIIKIDGTVIYDVDLFPNSFANFVEVNSLESEFEFQSSMAQKY